MRLADAPRSAIRPEYQAAVARLPGLLREFGSSLPEHALPDLATFMASLEVIDRHLDRLVAADDRRRLGDGMVAVLSGEEPTSLAMAPELVGALAALRGVIDRHDVTASFVGHARAALHNTERMRLARRSDTYLDCVEREGRLTAELALLLIAPHGTARFVAFFRAVAAPANLVDKLVDIRGDYRRGEIAVRPGARLHLRLVARLLRRLPRAVVLHRRPLQFAAWGIGCMVSG